MDKDEIKRLALADIAKWGEGAMTAWSSHRILALLAENEALRRVAKAAERFVEDLHAFFEHERNSLDSGPLVDALEALAATGADAQERIKRDSYASARNESVTDGDAASPEREEKR
jgi:hypothetical protein